MRLLKQTSIITACLFVLSCSASDGGDTFIRFSIDSQGYEIEGVTFTVANVTRPDWKYVEIGKDITRSDAFKPPTASLQWRMPFTDVESLSGKTIQIRHADDRDMADPIVSFELTKQIMVVNFSKADVTLTITTVTRDIVEGSFRGNDMTHIDDGQETTVDVRGTFRARIVR